jgi:hypothetical protein
LSGNKNKTGTVSTIVICLFLVAVTLAAITYRQKILDQVLYWSYKPTTQVADLISKTGMNDTGKFYFYASQPTLYMPSSAKAFNTACEKIETTTAILGCYSGNKIYIYNITDEKLDGINEVTAAHETLHAIYVRLSSSEKAKVDKMVEAEYGKISSDSYYADLTSYYDKAEPGQRDNELHSIIGTEIANLNPDLEKYYDQYFSNRQEVVNYNVKYKSVFKSLKSKADQLGTQLDSLSASIKTRTEQYNADANKLNSDIATFNASVSAGNFTSQTEYNNQRAALVARSNALEASRQALKSDIANYESLLSEYNSIATESKKLYDSIDSSLVSSPSL